MEDETPDEVVTPETPELPPVQDATPDDAAPETPVLPSDAVLPAVQDALPQTGVNWMAALGMAFSGMLLTIAGAFAASSTRKSTDAFPFQRDPRQVVNA